MLVIRNFILVASAVVLLAAPFSEAHASCGTPDATPKEMEMHRVQAERAEKRHQQQFTGGKSRTLQSELCSRCEEITINFHIIANAAEDNLAALFWTEEDINREVITLNQNWANTPFRFVLGVRTYTVNDAWANFNIHNDAPFDEIASALHSGDATTVNVYVLDNRNACQFAGSAKANYGPTLSFRLYPVGEYDFEDRVFMCARNYASFDPTTLTHEIGHWLKMAHTFQGNDCNGPGDGIDDTPAQSRSSGNECPVGQDSCPDQPGLDDISNYMDYSDCRDHFSEGQNQRMYDDWIEFRAKTAPCLEGEVRIGIDLLFDASSIETTVRYITWGEDLNQEFTLTIGNRLADYANKQAVTDFCVPANSMVEMYVLDSASNGLTAGSHVAFRLNNQEVIRYTDWDSNKLSVLMAADTETCGEDTLPFRMSLGLDNAPQFKEWSIVDTSGNLVVDQLVTAIKGKPTFDFLHRGRGVLYSICLPIGTYQFVFTDTNTNPVGISAPGYLELFVDDEPVYMNSGDTPSGAELIIDLFVGVTASPVSAPTPSPTTTSPTPSPTTTSPTPVPTTTSPTPAPTAISTSSPTSSGPPTCLEGTFFIPGVGCLCFSGDSTVETASGAHVALKDIRVGDVVKTTNGRLESIYAFGHYAPDVTGNFLEISTTGSSNKTIQLSPSHMIRTFSGEYVPASSVQVDDLLYGAHNDVQVTKLSRIETKGIYAPFTPSGTIVVDGIEASAYVSFTDTGRITVAGIDFSGQWLAHTFEFPHRVMCHHLKMSPPLWCASYNDAGVSTFVAAPLDMFSYITTEAPPAVFTLVMGASILVLILFQIVELVVFQQPLLLLMVATAALMYVTRRNTKKSV